jgi:hypothetical protein
VNDQQTWTRAVQAASGIYEHLSPKNRAGLDTLINQIMHLKDELVEQALSVDSASICRSCGGRCCLNGKYHVSVLDLLAYRIAATEPVVPGFNAHPACPYGSEHGCLMPPRFRPMACVVFNCELIEGQMSAAKRRAISECEQFLRETIKQANKVAGCRLDRPLLLSCEA